MKASYTASCGGLARVVLLCFTRSVQLLIKTEIWGCFRYLRMPVLRSKPWRSLTQTLTHKLRSRTSPAKAVYCALFSLPPRTFASCHSTPPPLYVRQFLALPGRSALFQFRVLLLTLSALPSLCLVRPFAIWLVRLFPILSPHSSYLVHDPLLRHLFPSLPFPAYLSPIC